MELSTRHLLQIDDLSPSDITTIFSLAKRFKEDLAIGKGTYNSLSGKFVINAFFEPSTRTRVSFEIAAKRLGANVINMQADGSSVKKGETLKDTAMNLASMGPDLLVMRHSESGAPHTLAQMLKIPIMNAGDGTHAHPSQALLDAMTLLEEWGSLKGKRVTIIGDILHSRVARSHLELLPRLGATVVFSGPPRLVPERFRELGAEVEWDFEKAVEGADAAMMLRMQGERWGGEDFWNEIKPYRMTKERADRLAPRTLIMAPGPINRGVEIDSEVADGVRSIVLKQVEHGIPIRMALLHLLGKGKDEDLN